MTFTLFFLFKSHNVWTKQTSTTLTIQKLTNRSPLVPNSDEMIPAVELTTLPDRWPAMAYSNEVTRMRGFGRRDEIANIIRFIENAKWFYHERHGIKSKEIYASETRFHEPLLFPVSFLGLQNWPRALFRPGGGGQSEHRKWLRKYTLLHIELE